MGKEKETTKGSEKGAEKDVKSVAKKDAVMDYLTDDRMVLQKDIGPVVMMEYR